MRRVLTGEQMRYADNYTINELGVPQNILMERAGSALAEEIIARFDKNQKILFACGSGNNGGDGVIACDILRKKGYNASKFFVTHSSTGVIYERYDVIVDCLLGTGLNKCVEGKYLECIKSINDSGAYVISCDIASGLNANNGKVMGVAVKPNLTICIGELKTGLFFNDGVDYSGETVVKDIGISVWGDYPFIIEKDDIKHLFTNDKRNVHKGSFGKVCVVGGSKQFIGGSLLTQNALATIKTGTGYTAICVPESLYSVYAGLVMESVMFTLKDSEGTFIFDSNGLDKIMDFAEVIAFGNGCGNTLGVYQNLKYLLQNYNGKMVIDADGLNVLATYGLDILKDSNCQVILTPHIKEFSRLSGLTVEEITNNPLIVTDFANEYGVTVILKSAVSIVTDGVNVGINITGNQGMAKAGSGDVLCGITAGLFSKGEPFESAIASSYFFGRCGDIGAEKYSKTTLTASEIIESMPRAINELNLND